MKSVLKLVVTLSWLSAAHAAGEERFGTDFDALFRDRADQIEKHTELDGSVSEVLKLEGGTVVIRQSNGQVTTAATDGQAVGCYIHILLSAAALDSACPNLLTDGERQWLDVTRERTMRYYAANIYPPQPYEDIDRQFGEMAKSYPWPPKLSCETGSIGNENVAQYIKVMIANGRREGLDKLLSSPRLPADNPCL